MVKRKARWLPLQDVLSSEVAWEQAAHVLDKTTEIALETQNVDVLLKIAAVWCEMALNLGSEVEDEDGDEKEVHEVSSKSKVGFG